MVSNSSNKIHQTWGPPFSPALYILWNPCLSHRGENARVDRIVIVILTSGPTATITTIQYSAKLGPYRLGEFSSHLYLQLRLRLGGGLGGQGLDAPRRHLLCFGSRDGRRAGLDPGGVRLGRLDQRRLLAGERVVLGPDGVGDRRRGRRRGLRPTRNLRRLSTRRRVGELFCRFVSCNI